MGYIINIPLQSCARSYTVDLKIANGPSPVGEAGRADPAAGLPRAILRSFTLDVRARVVDRRGTVVTVRRVRDRLAHVPLTTTRPRASFKFYAIRVTRRVYSVRRRSRSDNVLFIALFAIPPCRSERPSLKPYRLVVAIVVRLLLPKEQKTGVFRAPSRRDDNNINTVEII